MLKLGIALGLALVVAVLTAAVGLVQGARPLTILFRTGVSLGVFFLGGFLAVTLLQHYLERRLAEIKPQGKNIDIISKDGIIDNDELLNPPPATPEFKPFVPGNFDQVTAKE
jgi:hypothetical protein